MEHSNNACAKNSNHSKYTMEASDERMESSPQQSALLNHRAHAAVAVAATAATAIAAAPAAVVVPFGGSSLMLAVVEHNYIDQYTTEATYEDVRSQSSCPSVKRSFPYKLHYLLSRVNGDHHNPSNSNGNESDISSVSHNNNTEGGSVNKKGNPAVLDVESIVSWQPHGRCFLVHDQAAFVEHILPL